MTRDELATKLDHSVLAPDATDADAKKGSEIALKYKVASVCVKPCHVAIARDILNGSEVQVGTVIGFPHGGSTTAAKVFEAQDAVQNGATELDMVINIGALKSGDAQQVEDEIRQVVQACPTALIKVILENAYLTQEEKIAAYRSAEAAGAHYIKTSTGFAPTGATVEDLKLMRRTVSPQVKVKASGGLRTLQAVQEAIATGADRVGTSATESILASLT